MLKEKIDVVYPWVDGLDPVWREKRNKAYHTNDDKSNLEEYANVEGRFRNNNELLYSLRSLEKYFPEHGDIYIVTDNQIPKFLKDNTKIKIIFHENFMRKGTFPTFSSKNIASQIPNISGLSEKFLICNDDIFFGPDFRITDFFSIPPKFYFRDCEMRDAQLQNTNGTSGEIVLASKYPDYKIDMTRVAHTPKAVIKNDFFRMVQDFPDVYEKVTKEIFRDLRNPGIIGDLYSRWMLYTKKGVRGTKNDFYIQSHTPQYQQLLSVFPNLAFFCINDTHDDMDNEDPGLLHITIILEKLFPEKSSFEK